MIKLVICRPCDVEVDASATAETIAKLQAEHAECVDPELEYPIRRGWQRLTRRQPQ